MADDIFFSLKFSKVEKMEKPFSDNMIIDTDIQSFCDCLESDLKWKNMWEQLKSGNLHMNLCTWNDCVTDFVFHHRLFGMHSEAIGADKG